MRFIKNIKQKMGVDVNNNLSEESKELRIMALKLSNRCQDGNLQSVFSCLDIMWTLYDKVMDWSIENSQSESRDFFIISKGQATLALYPILIKKRLFNIDDVSDNIGKFDSRYCIQTDLTKFKGGIENNAGSLGHGLPFATGIAFANKIKKLQNYTYVLCGDGEFCEGTMWESLIFASSKCLDHLCVIVDDNDSVSAMVDMGDFKQKLLSFGFDVVELDGHDVDIMEIKFKELRKMINGKPKAVIAKSIRGFGSKTLTDNDIWFHKAPNNQELPILIKEVEDF